MAAKTYYYARVSSDGQNLSRQVEAFKADGADDDRYIIKEKQTGRDFERPAYQAMKTQMLREGDTLVVTSLDRLGRNKSGIKEELEYYKKHDIRVRILDLPTSNVTVGEGQEWILDMVNNVIIEVLASIAEQERITIRKRQAEGIAIAKAEGKYTGGHEKKIDDDLFEKLYTGYMRRELTKKDFARQLGVSRPTLDKILQRKKQVQNN